ncbi:hypothetical protein ON010_g13616 [Phytophthora cinnamomi]|nr:hypothetical protein ON010_g13616 [Phytophthora cinnamomi]
MQISVAVATSSVRSSYGTLQHEDARISDECYLTWINPSRWTRLRSIYLYDRSLLGEHRHGDVGGCREDAGGARHPAGHAAARRSRRVGDRVSEAGRRVHDHECLGQVRAHAILDGAPEDDESKRDGLEVVLHDAPPALLVIERHLERLLVQVGRHPHGAHQLLVLGHARVGRERLARLDHGRRQELDVEHGGGQTEDVHVGDDTEHVDTDNVDSIGHVGSQLGNGIEKQSRRAQRLCSARAGLSWPPDHVPDLASQRVSARESRVID